MAHGRDLTLVGAVGQRHPILAAAFAIQRMKCGVRDYGAAKIHWHATDRL